MNRNILLAGAAAVAAVASTSAASAAGTGSYAWLFGGFNNVPSILVGSSDYPFDDYHRFLSFNSGYMGGVAVGSQFGPVRAEGELSYRSNGLNHVTVQGEGVDKGAHGSVSAFAAMANAWYDIAWGGPVTPYIGGGIGVAHVHIVAKDGPAPFDDLNLDATRWAFAYQLGAGAALALGNGSALTFDYRYLGTGSFTAPIGNNSSGTMKYGAQSLTVGFKMALP